MQPGRPTAPVVAPDIDVVAFDPTFGASQRIPAHAPMLCLGGHPAAECLLGVDGSGQTHQTAIAIDRSSSRRRLMVDRIRELLDRSVDIRIVELPNPWAIRSG